MNTIFQIVFTLLKWIAQATGFTYNEVNIIGYYMILPFVYVILIDKIRKTHVCKLIYIFGVTTCIILIKDFTIFSDWLFLKSVDFLLSFEFLGWNYIVSSVLICVLFPAVVFIVIFHFAYPGFFQAIRRRIF